MKDKKVYVGLRPRKPSKAFIDTFLMHGFDDDLRPKDSPSKGQSLSHCTPSVFER